MKLSHGFTDNGHGLEYSLVTTVPANTGHINVVLTVPKCPGWSPAYLFEVVFVKCVCIWRTSVFFQFYGVLRGVIYNYSSPLFYYSKSHFCSRELCYW